MMVQVGLINFKYDLIAGKDDIEVPCFSVFLGD
jgi:hypothetical protein